MTQSDKYNAPIQSDNYRNLFSCIPSMYKTFVFANVCNNKHNPQTIPKFIYWISLLFLCSSMSLSLSINKLVFINVNVCNCRIINSDKLLPPATKLWQGNVFTPVCHSVHGGCLCPSMHHRSHDRGVSVKGGLCPGGSLSRGSLSGRSLCPGSLCPGVSLSEGLCLGGVSVLGGPCPGGLCLMGLC